MLSSRNVCPVLCHSQYISLIYKSAGLPACLIERCCSCFCSWLVLVPLFSCCAFLLRLNQGHPPTTTTTTTPTSTPTPTPTPSPTPTPLLLYSFLPSSPRTTLVVPVAHDIAYSITVVYSYSSQDAHGTDRLVLIWYAFHLVVPARACYSSCF